jgi:hypothetical protein
MRTAAAGADQIRSLLSDGATLGAQGRSASGTRTMLVQSDKFNQT